MQRLVLILVVHFLWLGCSEDNHSPAPFNVQAQTDQSVPQLDQFSDTSIADVGVEHLDSAMDSEIVVPDMSVPPPGLVCDACTTDADCATGGQCLTNQSTGEQFCGAICATESDCPRGTTCYELSETQKQCVPFSGSCTNFPPSDLGGPCETNSQCQNGASLCDMIGDRGYCTIECEGDADCTTGLSHCLGNRCLADWTQGPEGCGRWTDTSIVNCGPDDACPTNQTCLTTLLPNYPTRIGPVCGLPCDLETPCPGNTTCSRVGEAGQFCLPKPCECLAQPIEEAGFDQALEAVQLHRCDVGIASETLNRFDWSMAHDVFRLPYFNRIYGDAYGGYRWARTWRSSVAEHAFAGNVSEVIRLSAQTLGVNVSEPLVTTQQDLDINDVLDALFERAQQPDGNTNDLTAFEQLPPAFKAVIVRLINDQLRIIDTRSAVDAASGLNADFFEVMYPHVLSALITRPEFVNLNLVNQDLKRLATNGYDYGQIVEVGAVLAQTIKSIDWTPFVDLAIENLRIDTPYGAIIIQGQHNDSYSGTTAPLLLIDTGGNDQYQGPVAATSSWTHPVSVAVDLSGDDQYGFAGSEQEGEYAPLAPADEAGRYDGTHPQIGDAVGPMSLSVVARQGAGIMGVGILYDRSGSDRYLSHKLSQGIGIFGMGMLIDDEGNDHYVCEQGCQGAASFGVGVLLDAGGNDQFITAQHAQGYGYIKGLGLLWTGGGDDHYEAILGDPAFGGVVTIYPSAQNENSNASFAQGAGFGRRVANTAGVFASGGFGALIDEGNGTDVYRADIFAQATGYWFGTGLLADAGGPDVYQGRWYTQGSTAHYALSYFFEEGGNDLYNPESVVMATAVGQGHDLSHGWLVDYAGNDEYYAPGLGMGGGNDNGLGFFIDASGDDIYHGPDGTTFGGAQIGDRGAAFDTTLCLGVFIDGNGQDLYDLSEDLPQVGNALNWQWSDRRPMAKPGAIGTGLDTTNSPVLIP